MTTTKRGCFTNKLVAAHPYFYDVFSQNENLNYQIDQTFKYSFSILQRLLLVTWYVTKVQSYITLCYHEYMLLDFLTKVCGYETRVFLSNSEFYIKTRASNC